MIKKVKWNDYEHLGSLELDFSKDDGSLYNTIVLAGENGAGKTTILDTLAGYLNGQSVLPFEYVEYIVDKGEYRIFPDSVHGEVGFHIRIDLNHNIQKNVHSGRNNSENIMREDNEDLRYYGFACTKARSGFSTVQVKSVTTQQIDNDKFEPDLNEDFTRVKQLLIDIDGQDSSALKEKWERGESIDENRQEIEKKFKGYRFKKAFNDFFKDIKYVGIDRNNPNEINVMFEKHNQQIPIDKLSTGEKQIVFRGAHLLRNINSIAGGVVLIDEPELSMHPMWQKKILNYYRKMFTVDEKQTVQMILATHSEYVIQSALKDRENVLVIVLTDDNGTVRSKRITAPNVLPSVTAAETNYLAFGVPSVDYHIELYGWLQNKTSNHSIGACDSYIASCAQYDRTRHEKIDHYNSHRYLTLPTYIRNAIDHPDSSRRYTEEELKISIELLIELCR